MTHDRPYAAARTHNVGADAAAHEHGLGGREREREMDEQEGQVATCPHSSQPTAPPRSCMQPELKCLAISQSPVPPPRLHPMLPQFAQCMHSIAGSPESRESPFLPEENGLPGLQLRFLVRMPSSNIQLCARLRSSICGCNPNTPLSSGSWHPLAWEGGAHGLYSYFLAGIIESSSLHEGAHGLYSYLLAGIIESSPLHEGARGLYSYFLAGIIESSPLPPPPPAWPPAPRRRRRRRR